LNRKSEKELEMHPEQRVRAHLAFPGIGHVRAEGKGYAWVPANYAPLP
jgi:hypothetical protein